ncbi:MAG TPA: flagellar protein FlgN [Steroidobacteraceae bacterium]|nr:flagellar protein FlgN [Steroidobacteraceae bacterium]
MDPGVCREHLTTLLREECTLLGELEELLQRESVILETSDVQALEATTRARQERVGALARIEEQRRSLCAAHGFSADRAGLEGLIEWCDSQGTLLPRLRECAERAVRCRDLNDRNGIVVAAKLKRVEGMLGALTGRPTRFDTYSPRGYGKPGSRPGRVLGAA